MELVNIRDIFRNTQEYANKEVTIGGWVRSNRNSKNFGFIVVNDGTFFEPIQVVYADGLANYEEVCKINVGAAIIVKGQLVPTPEAKQPFEIQAAEVTIEGASTPDYPLQKKRHTFEYVRTISHLRPRKKLVFSEIYMNDLPEAVMDRLALEGAMIKQAFMTYGIDGSRIYKINVLTSDAHEQTLFLGEDGKILK